MKDTRGKKNKKGDEESVETSQSSSGGGDIVNDFIEDVWSVMTPRMVDRLKCVLKEDMGLSKQDVDKFIDGQREVRRQRICLKRNQRNVKIGPRNQWIKELSASIAEPMATILVGILLNNRNARTKRITEKVLERLCEITGEDTTVESAKTTVERVLVVVADQMATWIDEALTDMETTMEDKYMSAESLEAFPTDAIVECYPSSTSSASDASLTTDVSVQDSYEAKSKTATPSVATTDEEVVDVKRKVTYDTVDREEISDEAAGDGESKITKVDEGSTDNGGTEEESTAEEDAEEEEEPEDETDVEDDEETEDEEVVSEVEEEEDAETAEEDIESEEVEEEEEAVEEEEDEDLEEEELEGEETDQEDSVEEEGEEEEEEEGGEDIDEKVSSDDDIKEPADISTDIESKVSSKHSQKKLEGDILDLLKEDIKQLPREEDQSDRQIAIKEIIDQRLEKVAKNKLENSLDSLVKYDIDKAASIVANWVENLLASADRAPQLPPGYISQGPAFEIKRGTTGSRLEVSKVSSTSVAKKVAEARGLDPPLRKKKLPRTMSPMDVQSGKDWADWALGAADVGEEWGKWLDDTLNDAEKHMLSDRSKKSHRENYDEWAGWRDKRAREAQKWRVEKQKIKDEGTLWNRKMKSDRKPTPPERETLTHIY